MKRFVTAAMSVILLIGSFGCQTTPRREYENRLVPAEHPILSDAPRVRGVLWPMVYNDGPAFRSQMGVCSFYHEPQKTATGETFNPEALTAAHKTLPFGTVVRCTRIDNGKSVIVVINDRGPYIRGRIIDLSRRAARRIGMLTDGIAPCRVEVLAYPILELLGPKGKG